MRNRTFDASFKFVFLRHFRTDCHETWHVCSTGHARGINEAGFLNFDLGQELLRHKIGNENSNGRASFEFVFLRRF